MKRFNLPAPAFFFIVATRALLGAGVALLVSDKLGRRQRKTVGMTLVAIGALTTIPALVVLFGRACELNPDTPIVAS
jgi:Na+-driven multidrug efflux pump